MAPMIVLTRLLRKPAGIDVVTSQVRNIVTTNRAAAASKYLYIITFLTIYNYEKIQI